MSGRNYLMLSEQYLPLKGGHIVFMHELGRRISQVRVLTGNVDGQPADEEIDGVSVGRICLDRAWYLRPESLGMYARLYFRGAREIRARMPAAVLAARVLPEGLVAVALARKFGLPSVIFAHGEEISPYTADSPPRGRRRLTFAMKRRSLWKSYRRADLIIANSQFTRGLLIDGGIAPSRIEIVNPGTDPQRYMPMPPDAELIRRLDVAGKKVLLTVGRLMWRKGQDTVLQAMPKILQAVPDAVYVMVGKGEYEPGLRELTAKLSLEKHVRFLGEVPFDMLPALYNIADVFVMANRISPQSQDLEGFGIVFLEAGACEKPVIGGRSGGTGDAIVDGQTGLLVEGTGPDEVADAAIRLLKDPALSKRMGQAARQRICRDLTWNASASRTIMLLDALGQGRSVGQGVTSGH